MTRSAYLAIFLLMAAGVSPLIHPAENTTFSPVPTELTTPSGEPDNPETGGNAAWVDFLSWNTLPVLEVSIGVFICISLMAFFFLAAFRTNNYFYLTLATGLYTIALISQSIDHGSGEPINRYSLFLYHASALLFLVCGQLILEFPRNRFWRRYFSISFIAIVLLGLLSQLFYHDYATMLLTLTWLVQNLFLCASLISRTQGDLQVKWAGRISAMFLILAMGLIFSHLWTLFGNHIIYEFYLISFSLGLIALPASFIKFDNNIRTISKDLQWKMNLTRLNALQSRMNPHFLFNSLNTIYGMLHNEEKIASKAIIRLAELYHFLASEASRPLITLEEEWNFIRNFIDIMKLRMDDRLNVRMVKTKKLNRLKIPPLTIQPLVENCFKHNQNMETGLNIEITAQPSSGGAMIIITDNGKGFPRHVKSETAANIKDRLEYHYRKADVHLGNMAKRPGGRAIITINGFKNDEPGASSPMQKLLNLLGKLKNRYG